MHICGRHKNNGINTALGIAMFTLGSHGVRCTRIIGSGNIYRGKSSRARLTIGISGYYLYITPYQVRRATRRNRYSGTRGYTYNSRGAGVDASGFNGYRSHQVVTTGVVGNVYGGRLSKGHHTGQHKGQGKKSFLYLVHDNWF
tara:strand:+ start:8049 stop:8477 length:429 start_codon:yes stop_codon:yes gene_type:complete